MVKLSVIVPVFNSEQGIKETLDALISQVDIKNEEYEVLVVDNNSTDRTLETANGYAINHPGLVKVLQESVQSSYAARNKGINNSRGDILCFIDADMVPEKKYLAKILNCFKDKETYYAGVRVEIKQNKKSLISDYDSILGFRIKHNLDDGNFVPTCCLTVSRSLLENVGQFDPRLESGGDLEFGRRVFSSGYKQEYFDNITIKHPSRATFKSLFKKFKRIARGYAQLWHYYPDRFCDIPQLFKSLRFYLPNDPLKMYKVSMNRNLGFSFLYCFLLAFILVPLRIGQVMEFNKERKKLYKEANSARKEVNLKSGLSK